MHIYTYIYIYIYVHIFVYRYVEKHTCVLVGTVVGHRGELFGSAHLESIHLPGFVGAWQNVLAPVLKQIGAVPGKRSIAIPPL